MKQSGIYRIVNKVNGKGYVGSASSFYKRWKLHRHDLLKGKHHSFRLQHSWNKYGEDKFIFEVLEIVENPTRELLLAREQYWINYYNSSNPKNGYNICPIAGSCFGAEQEQTKINKERIKEFLLKNGFKPSCKAKDLEESHLGKILLHYLDKNGDNFDSEMVVFCKNYIPKKDFLMAEVKEETLKFCIENGFRPRQGYGDLKEIELGSALHNYITPVGKAYDKEFAEQIKKFPIKYVFKALRDKQQLKDFVYSHGHFPYRKSINIIERTLGNLWGTWSNSKNNCYDEVLVVELKKFPTWKQFNELQKVKSNGRLVPNPARHQ